MLINIHPENPEQRKINTVTECLNDGGIIIYPTDTVYALGCSAYNKKAIEKIYKIKKLDLKRHSLSLVCYDLSHISSFTKYLSNSTYKLMKKTLPGPYTFILNANSNTSKMFRNKKKEIGIRIPDNKIARTIVKNFKNPIATSSIKDNDVVLEYITKPELIYNQFKNKVDLIINGGYGKKTPSTIINCTNEKPKVERIGRGDITVIF